MKQTPIVGAIIIGGLEAYALHLGINGAMLGMAFAVIGGLCGYEIKAFMMKRKETK